MCFEILIFLNVLSTIKINKWDFLSCDFFFHNTVCYSTFMLHDLEKELGNKPKKLAPHSSQSAAKQPTAGKPEEEKPKPMGEVQQIQNLAKTTQYQKEQVDEKSTKEKEEEEKARKLTEEKMKRIKQMDEQIKQVKEELEAKSRLNSAGKLLEKSLVCNYVTPSWEETKMFQIG